MPFILGAIIAFFSSWQGARSSDFVCRHQEWTARHMNGELGWSLEKGRAVAAAECRSGIKWELRTQK